MNYLLDTQAFLWWSDKYQLLSEKAYSICDDPNNDLLLSIASVWEIQIKVNLGKLTLPAPLSEIISKQLETNRFELLHIELSHIYGLARLPHHHKDPFDRMLVAQAKAENLSLISHDPMMKQYSIPVIW